MDTARNTRVFARLPLLLRCENAGTGLARCLAAAGGVIEASG
jgi:hypothetical protein